MTEKQCRRCGDTVVVRERFKIRAYDFTEATAAFVDGHLCSHCWDDLMVFMSDHPLASSAEVAIRKQVAKRNRRETRRGCS